MDEKMVTYTDEMYWQNWHVDKRIQESIKVSEDNWKDGGTSRWYMAYFHHVSKQQK